MLFTSEIVCHLRSFRCCFLLLLLLLAFYMPFYRVLPRLRSLQYFIVINGGSRHRYSPVSFVCRTVALYPDTALTVHWAVE